MIEPITAEEVKRIREKTGDGLCTIRRRLTIRNLRRAINGLPFTSVEQKEVLVALLELVDDIHPADRDRNKDYE